VALPASRRQSVWRLSLFFRDKATKKAKAAKPHGSADPASRRHRSLRLAKPEKRPKGVRERGQKVSGTDITSGITRNIGS
jgi:hypothetical protein